jgi:hypothetical protein
MIALSIIALLLATIFFVICTAVPALSPEGDGYNVVKPILFFIGFVLSIISILLWCFR